MNKYDVKMEDDLFFPDEKSYKTFWKTLEYEKKKNEDHTENNKESIQSLESDSSD